MSVDRGAFVEVDVSGWARAHEETLGTKPKRWLQDPSSSLYWLMKDTTFNQRADDSAYEKGDDWAERVACAVAAELGLPAAEVELAVGGHGSEATKGVISRSVLDDGESLVHGNELLEEIGVSGENPHDRTGYTPSAVREVLEAVGPPDGTAGLSAWEVFVGYLVLDALVGNTDRHQENWAAVSAGGDRRLSPTFDHASCLGFQLDDEQRRERLTTADDNRMPESYADRARSRFEGSPSPLSVAIDALGTVGPAARQQFLDGCAAIEPLLRLIELVPNERMSQPSREFAGRVLRRNWSRLVSHPFGTL